MQKLTYKQRPGSLRRQTRIPGILLGAAAILIAALYGGLLGGTVYFSGDCIGYQFIVSENYNEYGFDRVGNLSDVIKSQINHWFNVNGRFVCHTLVQIFCSLVPLWIYGVANGLVYGLLVWLFASIPSLSCRKPETGFANRSWIALSCVFIAFPFNTFTPPLEINYVWGLTVETAFLICLLFKSDKTGLLGRLGWCLLALIAGQWNEAYVIPLGASLLLLIAVRKGRLSAWQWTGTILFGVSALTLCLAPSNFARLGELSDSGDFFNYVRLFVLSMIPLLAGSACVLMLYGTKNIFFRSRALRSGRHRRQRYEIMLMAATMILFSYLLGLAVGFSSMYRVLAGSSLAFIFLIMYLSAHVKVRKAGMVLLIIAGMAVGCDRAYAGKEEDRKYSCYERLYLQADDGRIYVPGDFLTGSRYDLLYTSLFFRYQKKSLTGHDVAPMKVLPLEALDIPCDSDYNAVVKIKDRVWMLVRSKTRPADLRLRRRIGIPGTPLTVKVPDRMLDFDSPVADVPEDTLKNVVVGIYVNDHPYLEAEPYIAP